ncbi:MULTISPECIES: cytochrome P450 [unclassified Streptomyces]|uniref:cytochrome P450 n=1 Tax=unclassified Streptomyces TaxID=2593676 RepID=UPI0022B63CE4|nr:MULTISPECIES: cytochrome P450 [unclassified Streptomyces]MCZ7417352.1 cytochrome P450 [Streptomyces sp. WMMC897]MCZ7432821.1 cytochrome P450 [Streptomyces sp. WMMC1477]
MTTPEIDPGFFRELLPFDPFDPGFHADPYPVYREVRERGPVVRTPMGLVVLAGHAECAAVLRDARFGWGDGATVAEHFSQAPDGTVVRPFIFMDPPDHTRIRSLVGSAFAARRVDTLRGRARELVAELLETAKGDGPVDLMSAVAHPLPAILLGELLGVPAEHHERFRRLSADIAHGLDPSFFLAPDEVARRDAARAELGEYFTQLAAERRANPAGDLISELVAAEEDGERLTEHELIVTFTLLLSAGYATTVNLIGNGVLALLRNPDQLAWLRANPDGVGGAVEELLRYDPPVQMISRTALEDVELAGQPIAAGEQLMLMIGAAGRDPGVHDEPDRLLLSRRTERNLGFGLGAHFCVGAPMARLTAQVAISALAELDLTLETPEPARSPYIIMRGLRELPVRIAPRG